MKSTTTFPVPINEDDVYSFINKGTIYLNKTYNKKDLVRIGLVFMKNNFNGYVEKYGIRKMKDINGRVCLMGEDLQELLSKKVNSMSTD